MKVAQCMSTELETVTPEQPIQEAARFMLQSDVGVLPVMSGEMLTGMITDRDIAVRAVAQGRGPETLVSEVMTDETISVYDDQDIEDAALLMSDHQIRRLPVKRRDGDQLIGVISLADISRSDEPDAAQAALEGVTDPGGEHSQTEEG